MREPLDQDGIDQFVSSTTFSLLDLEQRINAIAERLDNIVDRLAQLTQRVDKLGRPGATEPAVAVSTPSPAVGGQVISAEMARVVRLVAEGRGDEAQRMLQELPETELTRQPAVVALVAAALFVQRGDYPSAHKALTRARELTDDPRLLKLLELVQAKTG